MTVDDAIAGGLIVSCQAPEGSPLRRPEIMAAMAEAAQAAGSVGIRAQGAEDIRAIRKVCRLPVIGLRKRPTQGHDVIITPTLDDALEVVDAGADVVALDATARSRPGDLSASKIIEELRRMGVTVMADVDSEASAVTAVAAGADLVATTLAGHTTDTAAVVGPDVAPVAGIRRRFPAVPIVAEGHYTRASEVTAAFEAGAHAVVVGTAITDALALSRIFVAATPRHAAG
jgi:N-acylglucosamine-6-phosphate 2-epimerase